jgi:hypothetical protein
MDCTSDQSGGGIYYILSTLYDSAWVTVDSQFTGTSAVVQGGALSFSCGMIDASSLVITNTNFTSTVASKDGAFSLQASTLQNSQVSVQRASFDGCRANQASVFRFQMDTAAQNNTMTFTSIAVQNVYQMTHFPLQEYLAPVQFILPVDSAVLQISNLLFQDVFTNDNIAIIDDPAAITTSNLTIQQLVTVNCTAASAFTSPSDSWLLSFECDKGLLWYPTVSSCLGLCCALYVVTFEEAAQCH